MKPLVSVIVPVYKVADYLERCLVSLCGQSLHGIEIILVNDASPDRCGIVCEEYATKDARIKVIHHKENRGLSAARNTGIANASSDYLMFVDGDDWVHEDFCKAPYECAVKYQADLVLFNLFRIKYSGCLSYSEIKDFNRKDGYKSHTEATDLLFSESIGNSACNKLYNKKLFKTILYPEGSFYEDWGTTYKIVWQADQIFYLDRVLYYYSFRKNSITTLKTEKILEDKTRIAIQRYCDLQNLGYSSVALDINIKTVTLLYCVLSNKDCLNPNYEFSIKMLNTCEKLPDGCSWILKILFKLYKYYPLLFNFISRYGFFWR